MDHKQKKNDLPCNHSSENSQLHSQNFSPDPEEEYALLMKKLHAYIHDQEALAQVRSAYEFAKTRHSDQKRCSGEPYITHPLAVASILADLNVDLASVISAILHDVVEDTETSVEEIEKIFGPAVANLVDGLTKIRKIKFRSSQERMAENFRKMILAMAKDLRVILVKLADRLHNMRTLSCLPPDKRLRIAQETLDIYAPLASRLGIYGIKSELEDLCLKETKNEIYKEISRKVSAKKKQREAYIEEVIKILEAELKKYGFKHVRVYGRPKHFYSIYKKMVHRQTNFEDIHDLFAFRIIVDSVKDCYEALGVIHAMWKPMPGRFKDYIAMPKANLYQSLHTTVIRPNGTPAEIQIRTKDMHNICEYGVAAHWSYKETPTAQTKETDLKTFSWLRQMMELHHEVKDPNEFLDAVKVDLFEEEIFVFTPRGDVIQLASASTPLDFAFTVHTDIGLRTIGAKVNGKITPLRSKIRSGDIVEILTSPNQKPSKDWLNFVTTSKARNKIRSFLRSEQRERSSKLGRELLSQELSKRSIDLDKLDQNKSELLAKTAKESGIDELLIAIGYGKINASELTEKVFPKEKKADSRKAADSPRKSPTEHNSPLPPNSGVLVSGMDNILVTYGRCCSPLPGDAIVGYITRGRGVSVHRSNCDRALDLDPARRIEVSWVQSDKTSVMHTAYLKIVTQDRQGILADVTVAISSCGVNIQRAEARISPDHMVGVLNFEISLKSLEQLNKMIHKVEAVPNVVLVQRREPERLSRQPQKKNRTKN
ncbi:MAG: bifunctional (p)ppGpp synthetase/guanosine-3',5'-bis(diphosphate) 3'-pyrophosphohydrolase [Deltaproteobacteria bacterium]|nr:bifunctional (p)ppGpp synthetase/guanosine-3',5'-bis(diphosphate) 3'-pyrophosphohydrolase [Deltaproteobacteria bacterium]